MPATTVKTEKEYVNQWLRDSIYVHDSIYVFQNGDTVLRERIKTIYIDRLIKDSVFSADSIRIEIPFPVEVEKEVNRLNSFQSFQIWCGRIILLVILGWFGFKLIKKRFII